MEYCDGGDLGSKIQSAKNAGFNEDQVSVTRRDRTFSHLLDPVLNRYYFLVRISFSSI